MHDKVLAVACMATALIFVLPAASMAESYGAIALSPTSGATGWSHSFSTRRGAEQQALDGCYRHASDCRTAIWFRNACGAVATGRRGWGAGWGDDRYGAEQAALYSCERNSHGCRIIRWQCSGADEW